MMKEKRGEEEDKKVEILKNEACHAETGPQKAKPNHQKYRATVKGVAVTLGVMHLLIFTGIFIRYILTNLENERLQRKYDNLLYNHSQLQDEVKHLQAKTTVQSSPEMCCPEGWKRFGCSCYNKFTQTKNWEESKTDCKNREAYLVVINSQEEQKFIRELHQPGTSWIGLKAEFEHKSKGWQPKWKWVDGSPLTITFWEIGHSQKPWSQYVECCSQGGKWTQSRYYNSNNWICEKKISCFPCL